MSKSFLLSVITSVVCITWFTSIFMSSSSMDNIQADQDGMQEILTSMNSNQSDTLVIAGYPIPMVGEILTPIVDFFALLGSFVALVIHSMLGFLSLTEFIPDEALPVLTIFISLFVIAIIAFIRRGDD